MLPQNKLYHILIMKAKKKYLDDDKMNVLYQFSSTQYKIFPNKEKRDAPFF